jgi:hypothetical protein
MEVPSQSVVSMSTKACAAVFILVEHVGIVQCHIRPK